MKKDLSFNPRTREGCDYQEFEKSEVAEQFQSTHPRGVRPFFLSAMIRFSSFNPRTREGCDRIFKSALNINMQSYVFCDTTPNY